MLKVMKPDSSWHRMLDILDLNGGTLYRAQMYKERRIKYNSATQQFQWVINHDDVKTAMLKLTSRDGMTGTRNQWETIGAIFELVTLEWKNNRKLITITQKGRDVLEAFRNDKEWAVDKEVDNRDFQISYR